MNTTLNFELLYFEGCPSWKRVREDLKAILNKMHLNASVDLVRVETDLEAKDLRFVGSPSIRLNDQDLFPVSHEDYALGCRLYPTPDGMRGWPTLEMLEEAIGASWEKMHEGIDADRSI